MGSTRRQGSSLRLDAEHPKLAHGKEYDYLDFIKGADLLIFDAPYTHSESISSREHGGIQAM